MVALNSSRKSNKNSSNLVSSITNCSNHSVSSSIHSSRGIIVSITVRKDSTANADIKKAGIKLEQDSKGQVTVKNIAKNGLFGDTDLEIGDTILSVNRKRLNTKEGEGPELIMKWVHKYNTITISVRKRPISSSSLCGSLPSSDDDDFYCDDDDDERTSRRKSITKKKKKKNKSTKLSKDVNGVTDDNKKNIVTITAEVSSTIGLVLEIQNKDQLFVKDIHNDSIFNTDDDDDDSNNQILELGDRILTINDMSFRQYADVDYAYIIMNKAKICITLHVEKQQQESSIKTNKKKISKSSRRSSFNDDDDDVDTSIKSFTGDSDSGDELWSNNNSTKKKKKKSTSTKTKSKTNSSKYKFEIQQTDFKIEKYRPVTITVPTSSKIHRSTDSIGLEFRLVKTSKGDALNTIIENTDNNIEDKYNRTTWVYVHKIDDDSIFADTLLKEGDKIISINDVDLRSPNGKKTMMKRDSYIDNNNSFGSLTTSSDTSSEEEEEKKGDDKIKMDMFNILDTRKAYKACLQSKEFLTIIVLKDESVHLEKSFNFDNSMTNLEWRV